MLVRGGRPEGFRLPDRWCSFGSAVAGTDANITFYEYGQDGSVLHQTPTKIKVRRRNRTCARTADAVQPTSR